MKSIPVIAALAVMAAGTALADDPPKATSPASSGQVTFNSLDKNSDGRISADEARAHQPLSRDYSTTATDSTKGLTKAEFDRWASGQPGARKPDANPDDKTRPPM